MEASAQSVGLANGEKNPRHPESAGGKNFSMLSTRIALSATKCCYTGIRAAESRVETYFDFVIEMGIIR